MQRYRSIPLGFLFLSLSLCASTVCGKDTWLQVRSKNYLLIGNASEKDIKKVGTRLEQFRETFHQLFAATKLDTAIPTTVVVFRNTSSFRQFAPRRSDGKIDQFVGGFFQPGEDINYITLPLEGDETETFNTIFHESVHGIINANFGKSEVPAWFNEGLAEYYSTFEIEADQKVKLGLPLQRHLDLLQSVSMMPLDQLFNLSNYQLLNSGDHGRSIFYAESWVLVHYLIRNGKGPELSQFLNLVIKNTPPDEAFKQAFKTDYASLTKELKKYVGQSQYQYQIITLHDKMNFESDMTVTTLDDSATNAYLGDLLEHIHRDDDAEAYLINAIKLQPTSTMANTTLGIVKIGQRKFDDARRYLEAAIASDAQNFRAFYNYADLLNREGRDEFGISKEMPKESAAKIRDALKKAIALNPSYLRSYDLMAYVALSTDDGIEEAADYLQKALRVQPGHQQTALRLAEVYLRLKKYPEADYLVKKIAKNADEDDVRQQAERLAGTIRQMREYEQQIAGREKQIDRSGGSNVPGGRSMLKRTSGPVRILSGAELEKAKAEAVNRSINDSMRTPVEGEERVVGSIQKIECKAKQVGFVVSSQGRTLTFTSRDFQILDLRVFAPEANNVQVGCDSKLGTYNAVISYQPVEAPKSATAGEIVAIEFVPAHFRLLTQEEMNQPQEQIYVEGPITDQTTVSSNDPPPTSTPQQQDPETMRRNAVIDGMRNALAKPGDGEKREFGFLDKVECSEKGAFFIFHIGERKLKLFNDPSMTPQLRIFTPDLAGARFGCGIKPVEYPVVFIYKENPPKKKADGTVVSLEFMPKSFTLDQ